MANIQWTRTTTDNRVTAYSENTHQGLSRIKQQHSLGLLMLRQWISKD